MGQKEFKREMLDGQNLKTQETNNETGKNSNDIRVAIYLRVFGSLAIVAAIVFFVLYMRNKIDDSTVSITLLSPFIICAIAACLFFGFAKIIELLYDISISLKKNNDNDKNSKENKL